MGNCIHAIFLQDYNIKYYPRHKKYIILMFLTLLPQQKIVTVRESPVSENERTLTCLMICKRSTKRSVPIYYISSVQRCNVKSYNKQPLQGYIYIYTQEKKWQKEKLFFPRIYEIPSNRLLYERKEFTQTRTCYLAQYLWSHRKQMAFLTLTELRSSNVLKTMRILFCRPDGQSEGVNTCTKVTLRHPNTFIISQVSVHPSMPKELAGTCSLKYACVCFTCSIITSLSSFKLSGWARDVQDCSLQNDFLE